MKKYNWEIIIYDYHVLENIMEICNKNNYDYSFILHDKDIDEEGKKKKKHLHFLVFLPYQKTESSISRLFDVSSFNIRKVDNKIGAIRYLTHIDNKDKYQYQMEDIISTFDITPYFNTKIDNSRREGLSVLSIIEYINNNQNIDLENIIRYCIDNGLYSYFRRNQNILIRLYYEKK